MSQDPGLPSSQGTRESGVVPAPRLHFGSERKLRLTESMRRYWVAIALVVISFLYGGAATIIHGDAISPIDEVVYIDYTQKLWEQGLVREGELFGEEVGHDIACEGVIPYGNFNLECGADSINIEDLPNKGYTTGSGYTPAYFWTVRILGDPIHAVTGLSEITSWRLSGSFWLASTMLVLVILFRRWAIPNLSAFTMGLLFIASPYVWWTYTYISTDVSTVIHGAAVILVTGEAIRGRWSVWWLVPLAVLAPILKITNLLVFGLAFIFAVIYSLTRRSANNAYVDSQPVGLPGKFWAGLATSIFVAGGLQLLWLRVQSLIEASDHVVDQGVAAPLTASELVRLAMSGLNGAITHNIAGSFHSPLWSTVMIPLTWITAAGVIGAMMVLRWDPERGPVIWATGIAVLVALPALGILMALTADIYFPLPSRYAAGLIPATLLVTAMMLRNRVMSVGIIAYSGLLMIVGMVLAVYIRIVY